MMSLNQMILGVSMYKSFLSVKFGLSHFCLDIIYRQNLVLAEAQGHSQITSGKATNGMKYE